jgi:hypothetical protein
MEKNNGQYSKATYTINFFSVFHVMAEPTLERSGNFNIIN